MRPSIALLLIALPSTVLAGPKGGKGGGEQKAGRLGQVTSGVSRTISAAAANSPDRTVRRYDVHGNPRDRGETDNPANCRRYSEFVECTDPLYTRRVFRDEVWLMRTADRSLVRKYKPNEPLDKAEVDAFVGMMDTYESAGAANLAIAARDGHLRLAGSIAHYWEDSMMGDVSMTMPTLALGLVTPVDNARVFLDGGVAYVNTRNPMTGSEQMTGPMIGIGFDVPAGGGVSVSAAGHAMAFDDGMTAWDARFALRFSHVEAGFRVLDFSVGPALFGPELGVAF